MWGTERSPQYWLATFGKEHAVRCPVDGGRFRHKGGWVSILGISPGDIIVLTCAKNYPGFKGMVAGHGIVTKLTRVPDCIWYDYVPARVMLALQTAYPLLTPKEAKKRRYGYLIPNWIFPIEENSYKRLVEAGL